jgi:DNA-binding NarL/FixJ family response regulator
VDSARGVRERRFVVRTLLITVHSEDPVLTEELLEILPDDVAVTAVDASRGEVLAHQQPDVPDVVFVDAGPPAPSSLPEDLRAVYPSSFVVLIARDVDARALELGAAVEADAYLRRDPEVADTARLLMAAAGVTPREG